MNQLTNSALYKVLVRELKRLKASKVLLFSTLIAPLLSFVIIAMIFSAGVVRDLPVALVDNDHTALSRNISRLVETTPVAKTIKVNTLQEAHQLMLKGVVEGIVVIPTEMEKGVMKGLASPIALYINNANIVKGGLLYSGLYKTLSTISVGINIKKSMIKGMDEKSAYNQAYPVAVDSHLLFNPFGNYSYFLTLGVLPLMLVILSFLVSVYVLGLEFKYGTAKELLTFSEGSVLVALVGKMLPYTALFMVNALIMNIVLFHFVQIPFTGNVIIVLFSEFLLIVTYQSVAILFLNFTANLRLSLSLGSAYTMMALTFAGVTFPSMAMPAIAKIFSWFFPYTFWIKIFLSQTIRNQPLQSTIPNFLMLMLFIMVSMTSFWGIKRKLQDSKYWGRA